MKRAPLKRKSSFRKPKQAQTINKVGKGLFDHLKKKSKTDEWSEIREELKARFAVANLLSCELNLSGCTKASYFGWTWSFAHSLKRDKISTDPDIRYRQMREVIYTCGACHNKIEVLGNKNNEMYNIVVATIKARERQP